MSSSCTDISPLGCFGACDPIDTGIDVPQSGTWTAKVSFNGVVLTKEFEATAGQKIIVPNGYPVDLLLHMRLIKPDGQPLDDICYSFKNQITLSI